MAARKHVFGSNAERAAWSKLRRRWGDKYSLYPNLPFLMVFQMKSPPTAKVSEQELSWLKKTSIDFTLCDDATDAPLVCVEFDGMQEGFNVGTKYVAAEPSDPWRDQIMSLKLRVAHGSLFPYFVVGSEHFKDISEAVQVCIVDSIIGSVLAGRALLARTTHFSAEDVGMTSDGFEQLSTIDQDELIQDWLIGAEADADSKYNPVIAANYNLWRDLTGRYGTIGGSTRFVTQPSVDDAMTPIERAKRIDQAIYKGAECTLTTQRFGSVTRTVWLPNFKVPGFSALGFLPELAHLVTLDALRRLAEAHR